MPSDVSIVIPTWNGVELLKQFLPSVAAAANHYASTVGSRIEIVLVNDCSTDETAGWLAQRQAECQESRVEVRCFSNEKNLGFGKTVNRGMREAKYPLALLLNNDVEVDQNAIAPLVEHFSDPDVFAVHCHVYEFTTKEECGTGQLGSFARGSIRVHQSYRARGAREEVNSVEQGEGQRPLYSMFASGGSAMYDRERFLAIGAFDELLSPIYWEDVEISYRAWKRGFTVLYEPRSVVSHRVSSTMGKQNHRKIWRLQQRNRLIFHWINLHDRRMTASHALWLLFLTITAPLRLQPLFLLAVFDAGKMFSSIRRRRREEKRQAKRSDRDVFQIFREMRSRHDIRI